MPAKNAVSYNSIITACVQNDMLHDAFAYFLSMPGKNAASYNAMISGFVKSGLMREAQKLFEGMPRPNVVSYAAMIDGYTKMEGVLRVNLKPRVPTKAVCAEHLELRKEILTLLNLQKQVQYKEAEGSSFRDGSYGETPGTPKDRTFVPDSMSFGGERIGKKDHKRKGPGAPSPSAHKRPRKLKASDL